MITRSMPESQNIKGGIHDKPIEPRKQDPG